MSLVGLPGLNVIAGCEQIETSLLGARSELDQLRYWKLFVGQHEADHPLVQ
jgi:hypothetical protein